MNNQQNNQQSNTNVEKVKKQNQAAQQGKTEEFANETDAQEVKKQNQEAEKRKK